MTGDALDTVDLDDMAQTLGITETEARDLIRKAIAAGLLSVVAVTETGVTFRGEFPDLPCSSNERTNQ